MIDEEHGRRVLCQLFSEAGFEIEEDHPLAIAETVVSLDGYDPVRRVGYEYIVTAEGDRREFHEGVLDALSRLNEQGLAHIFLVDERWVPDEESLVLACREYLQELSLGR
jgi:hypothetical protein